MCHTEELIKKKSLELQKLQEVEGPMDIVNRELQQEVNIAME